MKLLRVTKQVNKQLISIKKVCNSLLDLFDDILIIDSFFLADAKKQERIEEMIADINKYKKLDREFTNLRQKYNELETTYNSKINTIAEQRDNLKAQCDHLKQKFQQYEQLKHQCDQLNQDQLNDSTKEIEQKINDLKVQNDQLRQSNWKNIEKFNKSLKEKN